MKMDLVCGGYPPGLDAIGAYTGWLAGALADAGCSTRVFTREGTIDATQGVKTIQFFDPGRPQTFDRLPEALEGDASTAWLVLQYNPFMYGKRGYCPQVPATLRRIKRESGAPKIAVMFHETMVPRWPWKFGMMYLWQKPIFNAVCAVADLAFVSTERWTPQVRGASSSLPVKHLPVGSNIPLSKISRTGAKLKLGIPGSRIVLGVFGSAHPSRQIHWIGAAARAVAEKWPQVLLLYVGEDGATVRSACEGVTFKDCGSVESAEVGQHLRAMDVVLSPFVDGVSTRRGSVMAALQHGLPVATTKERWTDRILAEHDDPALVLSQAGDAAAYVKDVLGLVDRLRGSNELGHSLAEFYEREFSWPVIARKMMGELKNENESMPDRRKRRLDPVC